MSARWAAGTAAAVLALLGAGMGKGAYGTAGGAQAMREIVHIQAVTATGGYGADHDGTIINEN